MIGSEFRRARARVYVYLLYPQSLLFLNWQELIIRGVALIWEVQRGEFEHLSQFKVVSVGGKQIQTR